MGHPTQNGQPEIDALAMCGPRPTPVTWALDILKVGQPPQVVVRLKLLSWNGEHVTFWPMSSFKGYIDDLRSALRQAGQIDTGIVTPTSELILPPGT